MDIDLTNEYPAGAEIVFALLGDASFIRDRAEHLRHERLEIIECGEAADGYRIHYVRTVPVTVPSFAARILSPRTTVEQFDLWSEHDPTTGRRRGTWWVRARGIPIEMKGDISLESEGSLTRHHIEGTMNVGIPILGSRLKSFLLADTRRAIHDEAAYAVARLETP